jgi:hypothetical protein
MRRAILVLFALALASLAQSPTSGRLTVSGSLRLRGEVWDWFQPDSGDGSYGFSGNILRLSLAQSWSAWDWTAEFAVPFLFGLPDDAIAAGTQGQLGLGANYFAANNRRRNAAMVFPKQLFVRFKNLGGSPAHSFRLGRFEFLDGSETAPKNAALGAIKRDRVNQRLLGGFGWSHVGRSFDGVQYSYSRPSGVFTVLAATPTRGAFQVDGWGWNRAAFGYASYTRAWGSRRMAADTRVFALTYADWRDVLKSDNRSAAARRADADPIRVETYGAHSVHAIESAAGTLDVLLWGALQSGHWGVEEHRARALNLEAGVQPKMLAALKPWLRGGFFDGSGDADPGDGRHGTFFQVLPTPRPFARFPFFNMMNNQDRFAMLILRPHP